MLQIYLQLDSLSPFDFVGHSEHRILACGVRVCHRHAPLWAWNLCPQWVRRGRSQLHEQTFWLLEWWRVFQDFWVQKSVSNNCVDRRKNCVVYTTNGTTVAVYYIIVPGLSIFGRSWYWRCIAFWFWEGCGLSSWEDWMVACIVDSYCAFCLSL